MTVAKALRDLLACALVAAFAPCFAAAQDGGAVFEDGQDGENSRETQLYSLNASREADGLARQAVEALRTKRWSSVFATFGKLVEEHGQEVLPAIYAPRLESQYEYRQGVESWVCARLAELDARGRADWNAWCEGRAAVALAAARRARDERELRELARRHPLSTVAATAHLALGDLALSEGHVDAARRAWRAAGGALAGTVLADTASENTGPSDDFAAALARRLDATRSGWLATMPSGDDFGAPLAAENFASDAELVTLPRGPLHRWSVELPEGPFTRSSRDRSSPATFALQGAVEGDRLYVSTSLRLVCIDLLGGVVQWITPEPSGWSALGRFDTQEFFEAIDYADAIIEPAVDENVVVAALQVPESMHSSYTYQGITVTSRIPERRLFAFASHTGEPLWNHAPGSGVEPLAESLAVAGPPLLHDGRLYVPCARVEGRIELRVLCIDPRTGAILWNTRVVSGQRALNMFNRHEEEFWSAPLTVHDDALVVCSQLGSVAALDLTTGSCRWQATYEPLPLPRNRGMFTAATRRRVWRNNAPIVVDNVVLASPTDAEDLVAIDFDTGRVLWSQANRKLEPDRSYQLAVDLVLGVRERAVVLGGGWLASWGHEGALADVGRLESAGLSVALPEDIVTQAAGFATGPRAMMLGDRVLVPSSAGLLVFGLDGVRFEDEEIEWTRETQGNVLVTRGSLVSVRADRVTGFLDIEMLDARTEARLAADPHDLGSIETAARILMRRSEVAVEEDDTAGALTHYERLRELVEPELARSATLRTLHGQSVRREADLLVARGQLARAAEILGAAADRATAPAEVLELLLALAEVERDRGPERHAAVLTRIEESVPDLTVSVDWLARDQRFVDWLAPASLRAVPARVWVAVQRAFAADATNDSELAVAAWQRCLERYGREEIARGLLGRIQFELSIAKWLVRDPGAYEPYEIAARAELDRASERRDLAELDEIVRRHPFAAAAREARALGVDWALASGDLGGAIDRGRDAATQGTVWTLDRMTSLAQLSDARGNGSFARALLTEISRRDPSFRVADGPAHGMSAEQVLSTVVSPGPVAPPQPTFGESVRLVDSWRGPFEVVGLVHGEATDRSGVRFMIHRRDQLESLPLETDGVEQRVPFASGARFPTTSQRTLVPEGLVWSSSGRLHATDVKTGRDRWEWPPIGSDSSAEYQIVQESVAGDGIALCVMYRVPQPSAAVAIELQSGSVLWEIELPPNSYSMRPIVAGGRALFVSKGIEGPSHVISVDQFTGSDRIDFDLGAALDVRDASRFAVLGRRLVVPHFDTSVIEAYDIDAGELAWRHAFQGGDANSRLQAIVESGGSLFALVAGTDLASGASTVLHEIEPHLGGLRTISQLDPGESVIGVQAQSWTRIDSPHLFTLWHDGTSSDARLSCIALPLGRRWTQPLRLTDSTLGDPSRTLPAVSDRVVAIVWGTLDDRTGREGNPRLGFFDLESGQKITHRLLPQEFAEFDSIDMRGFGDALWIVCTSSNESSERIEVWR